MVTLGWRGGGHMGMDMGTAGMAAWAVVCLGTAPGDGVCVGTWGWWGQGLHGDRHSGMGGQEDLGTGRRDGGDKVRVGTWG